VLFWAGPLAGAGVRGAFFLPDASAAAPSSSVAASWIFCNDVALPVRPSSTCWRTLRAASGSFSISWAASSPQDKPAQEAHPTIAARTNAAPAAGGMRHAFSPSTTGRSA
jgi:hypothetical protein